MARRLSFGPKLRLASGTSPQSLEPGSGCELGSLSEAEGHNRVEFGYWDDRHFASREGMLEVRNVARDLADTYQLVFVAKDYLDWAGLKNRLWWQVQPPARVVDTGPYSDLRNQTSIYVG